MRQETCGGGALVHVGPPRKDAVTVDLAWLGRDRQLTAPPLEWKRLLEQASDPGPCKTSIPKPGDVGQVRCQVSMVARSSASRSRFSEYQTHLPRLSPWTRPASPRIFRWCEMVGWLFPRGSTKSQTQTSPSGDAANMLRTRSRTGSAKALNPVASSAASTAPRGADRTDGQHWSTDRTLTVGVALAIGFPLPLTNVNE